MARLFVSYRREDAAGFAGRLTDALEAVYGDGSVFRDVDDIRPGEDFARAIRRELAEVEAVLVVMGPGWLDAGEAGRRRLEREDDFVRLEIEAALAADKPLLPVLVGGAQMPAAERLPAPIRPLAARQALVLRDASWRGDLAALQAALRPLLAADPPAAAGIEDGASVRRKLMFGGALLVATAIVAVGMTTLLSTGHGDDSSLAPLFSGVWVGRVEYPWGVVQDERFELVVHGSDVAGRASFLGVPRVIESGELHEGRLRFITRSEELVGDAPPRQLVHHYVGEPAEDGLRVMLDSRGSISPEAPVSFLMRRP